MGRKLYDRCMGACCEDIGLTVSPDVMERSYKEYCQREKDRENAQYPPMMGGGKTKSREPCYREVELIYPMLTFVKENKIHPEVGKVNYKVYHYTCKHFDKKKRICTIYKYRPDMCASYPNKDFCLNPKCQWRKMVVGRRAAAKAQKKKDAELAKKKKQDEVKAKKGNTKGEDKCLSKPK